MSALHVMPTPFDDSIAALRRTVADLEQQLAAAKSALAQLERAANPLPYSGMKIYEAIVACLKERGIPATRDEIKQALVAGGAVTGKRHPTGNIEKSIDTNLKLKRLVELRDKRITLPN